MYVFQESVTYGYTNEAFKRLRKIVSLPNLTELKSEKQYSETSLFPLSNTNTNSSALSPVPSSTSGLNVSAAGKLLSSSPNSPSNVLLLETNSNLVASSKLSVSNYALS